MTDKHILKALENLRSTLDAQPIPTHNRLVANDDGNENTIIACGIKEKPPDHTHNYDGPWIIVNSSFGQINSSTCSICGRASFNEQEIW